MRVLFSCTASEGHFRPLLPLAQALRARGHDVAFASAAAWRPRTDEEGFLLLGAGLSEEEGRARMARFQEKIFALPAETRRPQQFSTLFGRIHAPAKLPELLRVARSFRAEAIVHESGDLAAPIAAASLGIPSVNHSFGAMIPFDCLEAAREYVEPLWRSEGLDPDPYAGAFRGLFVDLAPASFAWEQPLGKRVHLRPAPESAEPSPPWVDELERPLVYVTMGTIYNQPELFRPLLDGLAGHGSALVTVGRNVDPQVLGTLPPRVRVERFVPQAHVLPRAAAVVSHGGSGTTLGALAYGLPLVLVPQAADQFDNAARAEKAGAAVVLRPGEVTAESIRAALERVLQEPAFAAAARSIASEIAQMETAAEVAGAVELHLAGG
ncbi:MAG TPA: nucleotide disphospho-sugar-binding domain-containing protein [Gaiellaceae bacterium]|nr:nucleotide disphospho-sugar-binding domain-containing protein [Gaiellaceae bacterium]